MSIAKKLKQRKKSPRQKLPGKLKQQTVEIKTGYFKARGASYLLKSIQVIKPTILTNRDLAKNIGISESTFYRIKSGKYKYSKESFDKINKFIENKITTDNKYRISEISKHIKRYGTISEKALQKINDKTYDYKYWNRIKTAPKEYLLYRFLYG